MAEEEVAAAENKDGEEVVEASSGGSKKKLLLIGIGAFVLILGLAGGAFFFLSGKGASHDEPVVAPNTPDEHAKPAEAEGGHKPEAKKEGGEQKDKHEGGEGKEKGEGKEGEKKPAKEDKDKEEGDEENFGMGKTFTFKPFSLNLGNPLENNYVRIEVSVEYTTPKAEKELNRRQSQLRDAIVSIISNKTREFLLNPDGKEQLRAEILLRINRYMKNKVEQVFITDILIQ